LQKIVDFGVTSITTLARLTAARRPRETGFEAEILDLGTEAELEDGNRKFGPSLGAGSTIDTEIFDEIDRIMVKSWQRGPTRAGLGWLAGWAGSLFKSFIMVKDIQE